MHTRLCFLLLLTPVLFQAQQTNAEQIKSYMQAQDSINGFSGCVLVSKGNKIILQQAYGLANREQHLPNTTATTFRIHSITKQFVAACILKLEEEGKLHTDDKLSLFFPSFPNGDQITLHMLLNQTSGLPREFLPAPVKLPELIKTYQQDISRDAMFSLICKLKPVSKPGEKWEYSNIGYTVLCYVIEKQTGMSFSDYVTQTLLIPLHMIHTGVMQGKKGISGMAESYYSVNGTMRPSDEINMDFMSGSGNMYSTPEDLYLWQGFLAGKGILSNASRLKMFTPCLNHYGYGISSDTLFHHHALNHNGDFLGFRSSLISFDKDSMCVIVCSNNESASGRLAWSLAGILCGIPVSLPYKHLPVTLSPEQCSKFAGHYGPIQLKYHKKQLIECESETVLVPESPTRFFIPGQTDYIAEFILNQQGEVISLVTIIGGIRETYPKTQ